MRRFLELVDDLGRVLEAAGVGAWRWDPKTDKVDWTDATQRLFGLEPGSFEGTYDAFLKAVHPDDLDQVVATVERMAAEGGEYTVRHRVVHRDGTVRWVEGQGRIILGPDGAPAAGLGVVYDITDRVNLEEERNRLRASELAAKTASVRWQSDVEFLVRVTDTLNATLNIERVAARFAELLVPDVADGCVIDFRIDEPYASVMSAHMTHGMTRASIKTAPLALQPEALRRLEAHLTDTPSDDPAELASLLQGVEEVGAPDGAVSWLVEPLRARGTRIGTVVAWRSGRPWIEPDQALLTAVARRGAVALDAAELYRERSAVAAEFYRSMNPEELPEVPGWDIDVHYRPATELVRLSGDFFDVFALPDGSWMMAVGDVSGKGIAAAGQAGLARAALRSAAQVAQDPAEALAVLNRVLLLDPARPMLTAVLARLTNTAAGRSVQIASAGHPVPLVVRADGAWQQVDARGTMLGYVCDPTFSSASVELGSGDALIMYTDGITEARTGDEFFRLERLAAALAEVAGLSASSMADAATMSADVWAAGSEQDDVALLVAMAQ